MVVTVEYRVLSNRFPQLARLPWRRLYARMAAYYQTEMGQMFLTQGRSRGHPWAKLAPSTVRARARRGRTAIDILQDTRRLAASFRPLVLSDDRLVFGTDSPIATFHDSDRARKQKPTGGPVLPQRKLVRVTGNDRARFVTEITAFLNEEAHRGGAA